MVVHVENEEEQTSTKEEAEKKTLNQSIKE